MKLGARVRMSPVGRHQYGPSVPNPWDCEGVISTIGKDFGIETRCVVNWDNGASNNYKLKHLEVVRPERKGFAEFAHNKL